MDIYIYGIVPIIIIITTRLKILIVIIMIIMMMMIMIIVIVIVVRRMRFWGVGIMELNCQDSGTILFATYPYDGNLISVL